MPEGEWGQLPDELMLMVLDRLGWEPHESAAVRLTCPRWRSTHDGGRKTLRRMRWWACCVCECRR